MCIIDTRVGQRSGMCTGGILSCLCPTSLHDQSFMSIYHDSVQHVFMDNRVCQSRFFEFDTQMQTGLRVVDDELPGRGNSSMIVIFGEIIYWIQAIGGLAAFQVLLQYQGAATPRPPAIPGGCASRTVCETDGLRPPVLTHIGTCAPRTPCIPGGCAPRSPCETGELRLPDPLVICSINELPGNPLTRKSIRCNDLPWQFICTAIRHMHHRSLL